MLCTPSDQFESQWNQSLTVSVFIRYSNVSEEYKVLSRSKACLALWLLPGSRLAVPRSMAIYR
jgi:hypothetical protein